MKEDERQVNGWHKTSDPEKTTAVQQDLGLQQNIEDSNVVAFRNDKGWAISLSPGPDKRHGYGRPQWC